MGKIKRISAFLLAIAMCFTFVTVASAYTDTNPNTHRNTGHHIADLIGVARTQLGYTELNSSGLPISSTQDGGYTKYGASFGESNGAWCAYFIAWCASQAGIPSSVLPRLGNCGTLADWFKARSKYYTPSSGYIPKTGDIIFYNWSGNLNWEQHVGIVTGVSGGNVYTIEGNTGGSRGYRCEGKTRTRSASYIIGYATPDYNDASTYRGSYSFTSQNSQSKSIAYSTSKLAVITTSATDITSTNATLNGSFTNGGNLYITSYGFYFGNEKTKLTKYSVGGSIRKSKSDITMDVQTKTKTELKPNTTYYYKSFVTIDGVDYNGPLYAVVTVNDKPTQLLLSEESINVGIGQTTELLAIQLPVGSTDKGITWKSANEEVAKVENGMIYGISYGKVIVTATTNYGSVTSQCVVNVLIPSPQNIVIENISETEIMLSWDEVENADGYIIYRTESLDQEFTEYKKLGSSKTTFNDDDLEPGKRYYYRLQTIADDKEYNSDLSQTVYTTARIASPENITISSFLTASIRLTWGEIEEANGYIVYRSDKYDGLYKIVGSVKSNEFIDTDVICGTEYFYKIVAENGNSATMSGYSVTVSTVAEAKQLGMASIELPIPVDGNVKTSFSVFSLNNKATF